MKNITLTLTPEKQTGPYAEPGHFKAEETLTLIHRGLPFRSGVGGWDSTGEGRLVQDGPMVKGPILFGFGLCSVIDNHGGTAKQREDNLASGMEIDVEEGDLVEFAGATFVVKPLVRGRDIWLQFEKLTNVTYAAKK